MRYLTGDVQASVAILFPVCRWLSNRDRAAYGDLVSALRPASLVQGQDDALWATLRVGQDINLLTAAGGSRARDRSTVWALRDSVLSQRDDWYECPDRFRVMVRRALLAKAVEEIAEDKDPSDVAVGLAWLLAQDPARPLALSYAGGPARDLRNQKLNSFVSTDEQWRGLVRWAVALGCVLPFSAPGRRLLVPDPTAAVAEELPSIGPDGLIATHFCGTMADSLPILDGGAISAYLRRTRAESIDPRGDATIGPAFAYALKRLSGRGVIGLSTESDSTYRVVCMLHGERWVFDRVTRTDGDHHG